MFKKILASFFVILWISLSSSTYAFLFWLKSSDNTVEDIVNIEKTYNLYLPLVGFIFDPWEKQDVVGELKKMKEVLWEKRIYHITVSPDMYTAQEVSDWKFDEEYTVFFKTIKELNLKVIFRTMHEMNGGWYPWSSQPEEFKKAWIHVWNLSRYLGLTEHDILFDFSVNHRDMPTKGIPSQSASLIQCTTPKTWENKNILDYSKECYRFEDYYPWDKYVDFVWVTFYNWGKATSSRLWKSPSKILNDSDRNTVERLKKLWKPLFIDEVWTTAIWYSWAYDKEKSREEYIGTWGDARKNKWLKQLSEYLTTNNFLWAVYFNVDYTYGLTLPSVGETDWAIINPRLDKFYEGFWDLYSRSASDFQNILNIFWVSSVVIKGRSMYAPLYAIKNITFIEPIVSKYFSWNEEKISEFYKKLISTPSWKKNFDEAVAALAREYIIKDEGVSDEKSSWSGEALEINWKS